jgi:hypothetical protein
MEKEHTKIITVLMQCVEETMCEAEVDYPAGYEAGPRVSYDRDFLETWFRNAIETESKAREDIYKNALEYILDGYGLNAPEYKEDPDDPVYDWIVEKIRSVLVCNDQKLKEKE